VTPWFMIRNCKTNEYEGPYDESRAKKEAITTSADYEVDVEVIPLGNPVYVAHWRGVEFKEVRR
jgi:hypothetical protein